MLVIYENQDGTGPGEQEAMRTMGEFAAKLGAAGKLKGGAPLFPVAQGARVQVRSGKAKVTDGPFAETKEIIGGYMLIDAATRDEAVELAQQCPAAEWSTVEVREVIPVG